MPNPLLLTSLNYALLGLIRGEARSGYAFLASFEAAARDGARELEAFMASDFSQAMPLQSQLAVGYGLATCKSRADWAADAHRQLSEALNS